jgi:transposase, IS5 family
MPKQPAFPGLRDAMKKKLTRREQFLAEMDAVVPWGRLLALIEPHYPKVGPKGGRPPMPLETMLRVYFLQNWYALSDPMAEETLYDSEAMRRFARIELGDDRIPDETTILNFRHLLERHGLTEAIFAEVNAHLADKGITLRSGTLVDATIIDAPSSTKNKARARDPEMSSTKKGNDWYFGMKAHVGVDLDERHGAQPRHHDGEGSRQPGVGRTAARRGDLGLGRQGLRERRARGGVQGAGQGLGRHAQGAEGQPAAPGRRTDQPHHRHGAREGRAPLPRPQAPVRLHEDPLPRPAKNRAQLFTLFALGNLLSTPEQIPASGRRKSPAILGSRGDVHGGRRPVSRALQIAGG